MKHTEYLKKKNKRERRKKLLSIFAAFVVFITTYALGLPAITLDVSMAKKESGIVYEQMQFKAAEVTAVDQSGTTAADTAAAVATEETAAEFKVLDFDDILTGKTAFYYYHPKNEEEAEDLSSEFHRGLEEGRLWHCSRPRRLCPRLSLL